MSLVVQFALTLLLSAHAAEDCSLREQATPKGNSQDLLRTTIFRNRGCSDLKKIWGQRSKYSPPGTFDKERIKSAQTNFERPYVKCMQALNKSCQSNARPIDLETLNKEFVDYKKDPLLRMKSLEIHCLYRAQILAYQLSGQGYEVDIAKYEALSLVGLLRDRNGKIKSSVNYGGRSSQYPTGPHYVVRVKVLNNGKSEYRILDPQFAETPLSEEQYSHNLAGDSCSEKPISEVRCKVEYRSLGGFSVEGRERNLFPFLRGEGLPGNECGTDDIAKMEGEIRYLNDHLPEPPADLPPETTNMSEEQVLSFLHKQKLADMKSATESLMGTASVDSSQFSPEIQKKFEEMKEAADKKNTRFLQLLNAEIARRK